MHFFSRFNPLRALGDLRRFLASRKRYEIYTLFGAAAVTWTIMWAFVIDSKSIPPPPYKPNIIYVQSWRADRPDSEIKAEQARDAKAQQARKVQFDRLQRERQEQFKKLDDKLKRWGI